MALESAAFREEGGLCKQSRLRVEWDELGAAEGSALPKTKYCE